jgi:hypothetical protein
MPDLVSFARRQLVCLRDTHPSASGGTLQIAEIAPNQITT